MLHQETKKMDVSLQYLNDPLFVRTTILTHLNSKIIKASRIGLTFIPITFVENCSDFSFIHTYLQNKGFKTSIDKNRYLIIIMWDDDDMKTNTDEYQNINGCIINNHICVGPDVCKKNVKYFNDKILKSEYFIRIVDDINKNLSEQFENELENLTMKSSRIDLWICVDNYPEEIVTCIIFILNHIGYHQIKQEYDQCEMFLHFSFIQSEKNSEYVTTIQYLEENSDKSTILPYEIMLLIIKHIKNPPANYIRFNACVSIFNPECFEWLWMIFNL
jgi:hypothetical protein